MSRLENKRCCPHCGAYLHAKPYLMARSGQLIPGWRWFVAVYATVVLAFVLHAAT